VLTSIVGAAGQDVVVVPALAAPPDTWPGSLEQPVTNMATPTTTVAQ
jgi:hypothetical protein